MLPRKTLLTTLALAATASCQVYPLDVFLPGIDVADSISSRTVHSNGQISRWDAFVRDKDQDGRPLRLEERLWSAYATDPDSIVFWAEWNQVLPKPGPGMFAAASRRILALFVAGQETYRDTVSAHWDDQERILIHTTSKSDAGCRWQDSCRFDPQGRLVYQYACTTREIDSAGTIQVRPYGYVYKAWFEKTSDTLPREITQSVGATSDILIDSLHTIGEVNRPDSIQGTDNFVLVRDAAGHILLATPPSEPSYESHRYQYDAQGRIVQSISTDRSSSDTTTYLYSWSDPVVVRHLEKPNSGIRLLAEGIQIDLSAPSRIQVDVISLGGKRIATLADRIFPTGRSWLPLSVRAGDLVRIATGNYATVLVVPVR